MDFPLRRTSGRYQSNMKHVLTCEHHKQVLYNRCLTRRTNPCLTSIDPETSCACVQEQQEIKAGVTFPLR